MGVSRPLGVHHVFLDSKIQNGGQFKTKINILSYAVNSIGNSVRETDMHVLQ